MKDFRINSSLLVLIVGIVLLQLFGASGGSSAAEDATTRVTPTPATKESVSPLETEFVFPGCRTQGQKDAMVRPGAGCELVTMKGTDGVKIVGLFGKAAGTRAGLRPVILYFYGNGMCLAYSMEEFNRIRGLGFNVMTVDYEGYGMSAGRPSEAGCYAAADASYDYLLTRKDVDQNRIVATGWSLGGAVAIDLASRRGVAGLVTFSAFTSIEDMSRVMMKRFPISIPLESRFDNLAKIATVPCPIFMAHGTQDPLVPPEMMERLSKAARSKVTVVHVEGAGHNDIFYEGGNSLFGKMKGFVDGLSEVKPTTRP